eukprot:TRINITY_DN8522_c0_g1_i1.p2 TRINITY_DN8522_c0_g1~~TRINITY_DN8522_c0_g1_i1.p2  ORF type:complete len:306 (-),score=43.45 TRINITY_DN8522_c0_g1_i1:130-1047(-)
MFLFNKIDSDKSGSLSLHEFFELCDALLLRFKRTEYGNTNKCSPPPFLVKVYYSRIFNIIITAIMVVNIIIFCLYGSVKPSGSIVLYIINSVILFIFIAEILLGIWVKGKNFLKNKWDIMDCVVVLTSLVGFVLALSTSGEKKFELGVGGFNRFAVSLMSFTVIRIIPRFRKTRLIFKTVLKIIPLSFSIVAFVVLIMYSYAIIGTEAFATVVSNTDVATGFGTFASSLLLLFQQLTTSNWNDMMYQAMKQTERGNVFYYIQFCDNLYCPQLGDCFNHRKFQHSKIILQFRRIHLVGHPQQGNKQ